MPKKKITISLFLLIPYIQSNPENQSQPQTDNNDCSFGYHYGDELGFDACVLNSHNCVLYNQVTRSCSKCICNYHITNNGDVYYCEVNQCYTFQIVFASIMSLLFIFMCIWGCNVFVNKGCGYDSWGYYWCCCCWKYVKETKAGNLYKQKCEGCNLGYYLTCKCCIKENSDKKERNGSINPSEHAIDSKHIKKNEVFSKKPRIKAFGSNIQEENQAISNKKNLPAFQCIQNRQRNTRQKQDKELTIGPTGKEQQIIDKFNEIWSKKNEENQQEDIERLHDRMKSDRSLKHTKVKVISPANYRPYKNSYTNIKHLKNNQLSSFKLIKPHIKNELPLTKDLPNNDFLNFYSEVVNEQYPSNYELQIEENPEFHKNYDQDLIKGTNTDDHL